MIMRINKLIIYFIKKIVKDMSDSQIKLLQTWLCALSNALFALRSEAKQESLSFRDSYRHSVFEQVDKNVSFWSTYNETLRLCRFSIELPRKPGEDFVDITRFVRVYSNAKKIDEPFLCPTGAKGRSVSAEFTNENTPNHSSFGIEIIDFKDSK